MRLHQLSSGRVQMTGSPIVSEPFPEAQDVMFLGGGQSREIGKARQELLELRRDGRDSGLLKHDLADPNSVRVAITTPGEFPTVKIEPVQ